MKAFVLTYSAVLDYVRVQNVLNTTRSVETWLSPFPFSAIVVSKLTVSELSAVLHSHFGDAWFIVVEANQHNSNGWLSKEFWDYIADPHGVWSRGILSQLTSPSVPPAPGRLTNG